MITSGVPQIAAYTRAGWWGEETLYAAFARRAAVCPDDEALVDPPDRAQLLGSAPRRFSYRQLLSAVDAMAAGLGSLGARADDVVITQLPNTWECVALLLAAAKTRVILSPVAMQYRALELRYIAERTRARTFITVTSMRGADRAGYARRQLPGSVAVCAFGEDVPTGVLAFPSEAPHSLVPVAPSANDVLTVCWTSGTEGRPKGVPRSHNHWWAVALAKPPMACDEVYLAAFPMVAMASIGGQLVSWLRYGGKMLLHHPFDPAVYLRQLREERATYASLPPTLVHRILADSSLVAAADLSSLRSFGSGSSPLSIDLVQRFEAQFGVSLINNFGSNEGCTLFTTAADLPAPALRAAHFPARSRRIGPGPYDGGPLETRLKDPQTGDDVDAPGLPGELWIRGPTVFDGYWDATAAEAPCFDSEGYFRTGDLLELVPEPGTDRLLYRFVGRQKEIIVRGGMKISPAEIENVLGDHPRLREVACIGFPDAEFGERVALVCVTTDGRDVTLESVTAYLRERGLAVHKLPERLVCRAELPRNPTGKVLRGELREWLAQIAPP